MSTNSSNREPLLNLRQAAEWLAVSQRKVWQLSRDGMLPAIRIGRALRFAATDVNNLIEKLKAPARPEKPQPWCSPWAALRIGEAPGQGR